MRHLLAVAAGALLAVSACNAILGLDERPAAVDDLDASRGRDGDTPPRGEGGGDGDGGTAGRCDVGTECGGACVDTQSSTLHCGRCFHDCQGAACTAGMCDATVVLPQSATRGEDLYFDLSNGDLVFRDAKSAVERCNPSNCAATASFVVSGAVLGTISAGNSYLYWADPDAGTLQRYATVGGIPTTVATFDGGVARGLAVGAGMNVYFTYAENVVSCKGMCIGLPSFGSLTQPTDLAVASKPDLVFVDDPAGGGVFACNGGCTLWAAEATPSQVTASSTNVYWYAGDRIRFCSATQNCTAGGAGTIVDIPGTMNAVALRADETGLYWAVATDGIFSYQNGVTTKLWSGVGTVTLAVGTIAGKPRLFFGTGASISSIPR